MPRTLLRIVGCLLAVAVVVPVPSASAQLLGGLFRRQQTTAKNGRYEMSNILSDEHQRLTEMQVELALLSDIATFPYEFHAHANGNTFELAGNVPNDVIRQRAMDLARHTTVLRGIDGLRIQPRLSVQSTLRPTSVVQQEGFELLKKELGGHARQLSLEVRPNGVVVLTGRTDSVESKVEISRLFRQLPGCTAVINELTIEPVMVDGQRMVRVMRNNMMFVPPSVLGPDQEAVIDDSPATVPANKKPQTIDQQIILPQPQQQPSTPPPAPLRTSNLDAREGDLNLPAVAMKQSKSPAKSAPEKIGDGWEAFAPSKLPVKWGRSAGSLEAQANDLEATHSQAEKKTTQTASRQSPKPPKPPSKPAELEWTSQPSQSQDKMPTPIRYVGRPDESFKTKAISTSSKKSRASARSSPNFAETRETPESPLTWRRPGSSEESEPKSSIPTKDSVLAKNKNDSAKAPPSPPAGLSVQSSRRWPPAYVTGPPPNKGRLGVIVFEDDPPAPPKPTAQAKPKLATAATGRPVGAEELQRQIKSLCGRQAREVIASTQHDGTVLVRVKVANRSIEEQLSRKILSLPEVTSPRVRLLMEIEQ